MPISSRSLADGEEVLVDVRPHWIFLLGPLVLTAVAGAVAVGVAVTFPSAPVAVAAVLAAMVAVPVLWLVGRIVRWLGISLVVTTTRLLYRRGVLGRDLVQLRLQRVTEIHCTQTLLDRLIGSGRLIVEIAGESPMVVEDVRRPRALQRVITHQLDELEAGGAGPYPDLPAAGGPSDVPARPMSVPRPLSMEETPPHGVQPRSLLLPPLTATTVSGGTAPADWSTSAPAPPAVPPAAPAASIPDQLIQLDDLRRRGIVSEAEFEAKKAELLSRL